MIRFGYVFLLLVSTLCWSAPNIILLEDSRQNVNVGQVGSYFTDTHNLSLREIIENDHTRSFIAINNEYIQFGLTSEDIWVKASIASYLSDQSTVYLSIKAPRMQEIDVFLPHISLDKAFAQLGEARSANTTIHHTQYVVPIQVDQRIITEVYIRLSSHLPINAQIKVLSLSELSKESLIDFTFTGIIVGIIFILLISNSFFFLKTRNPMYFTYSLLLMGLLVLHFSLHGFIQIIFPEKFGLQEKLYNLSSIFCIISIIFFSRYYLNTKEYLPKADTWLTFLIFICIAFGMIFFINPDRLSILYLSLLAVIVLLSLSLLAFYAYAQKVPYSGYYLIARLTLLMGHCLWVMSAYGFLPSFIFYQWGLTSFILIEALIHFIGMVSRLFQINSIQYPQKTLQTNIFQIIHDIGGRMQRQLNILRYFIQEAQRNTYSSENKDLKIDLVKTITAERNLLYLANKLDFLYSFSKSHQDNNSQNLQGIIESVKETFDTLDQDGSHIDFIHDNFHQVEIIRNGPAIYHLLLAIAIECRHLNGQILTIQIKRIRHNHYGVNTLEIICSPIPTRVMIESDYFNLGIGFITELVKRLDGSISIPGEKFDASMFINITTEVYIPKLPPEHVGYSPCELLIVGDKSKNSHTVLQLVEDWPDGVTQVNGISDLLLELDAKATQDIVKIVILFEDDEYIPNLILNTIRTHIRVGDQCLLISDNVRMSRNYALTLGFDDFFSNIQANQPLRSCIDRLAQRGQRIRKAVTPVANTR